MRFEKRKIFGANLINFIQIRAKLFAFIAFVSLLLPMPDSAVMQGFR